MTSLKLTADSLEALMDKVQEIGFMYKQNLQLEEQEAEKRAKTLRIFIYYLVLNIILLRKAGGETSSLSSGYANETQSVMTLQQFS